MSDRPVVRWVLLEGNRLAVAGALLAAVLLTLVGLERGGVVTVTDPDAVRSVAGGFIPGLFTFLSIVLAINQLVLSQEFGSADEVRTRVEQVREFRHDVEGVADAAPSPVLPTAFLALVVRAVEARAERVGDSLSADVDPTPREATAAYAASVAAEAGRTARLLEESEPGRVPALLSVLEYRDSEQLYEARRLRSEYGDALPESTRRALSEVVAALELFSVARTHFRTSYTQRVLARLSRTLLYVGIPALLAAVVLNLLRAVPLPAAGRLPAVVLLLVVAFSPLAVLCAYILRIATVSERTIAVGPFVSRPGAAVDGAADGERASVDGTTTRSDGPGRRDTDAEDAARFDERG